MAYKEPTRRKITVPIAPGQRRPSSQPASGRPEWLNGALLDSAVVIGTTLVTTLLLLLISGQIPDTTAGNLISRSTSSAPVRLPSPTPEPSLLQHSSPSAQPVSSIKTATTTPAVLESPPDDAEIQTVIDKRLQDDPNLSGLNLTATVTSGGVLLTGTVESDDLKARVDKLVRAVKGVKQVDNQIAVVSND